MDDVLFDVLAPSVSDPVVSLKVTVVRGTMIFPARATGVNKTAAAAITTIIITPNMAFFMVWMCLLTRYSLDDLGSYRVC